MSMACRMAFERGTASISLLESAWLSLKGGSLFLRVAGFGDRERGWCGGEGIS